VQQKMLDDMSDQVGKLQRRLTSREASARKYKEGCRTLKAQVEHLEEVQFNTFTHA
jgi:peptidoglycan hydrolase CwlO-like protein